MAARTRQYRLSHNILFLSIALCFFLSGATAKEAAAVRGASAENASTRLRGNVVSSPRQLMKDDKDKKKKDEPSEEDEDDIVFTDREDSNTSPGGIRESSACVQWSTIIQRQKDHPNSDNQCTNLVQGFYPYSSGCCRLYYDILLVMDADGTRFSEIPCICNRFTNNAGGGTININPGPALIIPVTPNPTPAPVAPVPPPTTARPTLMPTQKPVTARPTTARPPATPSPPTTAVAPPPAKGGRWSSTTCSARESQPFWTDPAYTLERKCFLSEECTKTAFSCCLADKCLCGEYRVKDDECVASTTQQDGDRTENGGGPVLPDFNTAVPDYAVCERPENQQFWDSAKYPEFANESICTSSKQCRFGQNSCCLANTCLCGEFNSKSECVPALANPNDRTVDGGVAVPQQPDKSICERIENQLFWDTVRYPQYADRSTCTSSLQCRFGQNSCCLTDKCFCGEYNEESQECVPS